MGEMIALIISALAVFMSVGSTAWVYKIMDTRIQFLKEDIEKLKQSENRWMTKYKKLLVLILDGRCHEKECPVYEKYKRMSEEEGVL